MEDMEIRSRGIAVYEGSTLSHHAEDLLRSKGLWFAHTSQQVQNQDVAWADIVLTMTEQHKQMLLQLYPEFSERVFTLTEAATGNTGDVADPYGGNAIVYEQAFTELEQLIEQVVSKVILKGDI